MRFEQLLRFAALRLTRELGVTTQVLNRRSHDDVTVRTALLATSLAESGTLTGALRIPSTAGDIAIEANLRTGRITTSIDLSAPNEGRNQTRVLWLLRQLAEAHPQTRVEARAQYQRTRASELLIKLRDDPTLVIEDKTRPITAFAVTQTSALGTKRGVGKGGFIDSVIHAVDMFYSEIVQQLRPWSAKAPKRTDEDTALLAAGIDTTPLPEPGRNASAPVLIPQLDPAAPRLLMPQAIPATEPLGVPAEA
jgi:hypothetical protein